jgi:purine-binding chemotaxis protein CheW
MMKAATALLQSAATHENSGPTEQFATFKVGDLFMGIELSHVQELMRCQDMAMVPLAPAAVEGLINLRGQIVTALDMRKILGLAPLGKGGSAPMNIVVHCDGGPVSLLVDEICDVLDVPSPAADQASTQLPENVPSEQRALLKGVHQLESRLLLVLNTERVIQAGAL